MSYVASAVVVGTTLYAADQQADASSEAAGVQAASTEKSIEEQKRQFNLTRADLSPYRQAGESTLPGLQQLVNDPEAQRDFITENPFFESLADESQSRIFQNKAARGKVGSGETAEALQNSLLLLGSDLLNQSITQRQNLVNTGLNAATQTGQLGQQSANTIANLRSQGANAKAAGIVGAQNAQTQGVNNAINTGVNLYALNQMYGDQ